MDSQTIDNQTININNNSDISHMSMDVMDDRHRSDPCSNQGSEIDEWLKIIEKETHPIEPVCVIAENRYLSKYDDSQKHDEKAKHTEHINIDDIKMDDIKMITDILLLEKASMIAKNLKFQFNKRSIEDIDSFNEWMISSLMWLRDVSFELSSRNGQPVMNFNTTGPQEDQTPQIKKHQISRNSYKFCEFGHGCKFNYERTQNCYSQHYVYNLVYIDILDILIYISERYSNNLSEVKQNAINHDDVIQNDKIKQDLNEIKTSINTITYVINHMFDELTQLKNTRPEHYIEYEKRSYRFKPINTKTRQKTKKNEKNKTV